MYAHGRYELRAVNAADFRCFVVPYSFRQEVKARVKRQGLLAEKEAPHWAIVK